MHEGTAAVEGIEARCCADNGAVADTLAAGRIAVVVDPDGAMVAQLRPDAVVDAILAKQNLGTAIDDAPVVMTLGPGFTAGKDCHAVVETQRRPQPRPSILQRERGGKHRAASRATPAIGFCARHAQRFFSPRCRSATWSQ